MNAQLQLDVLARITAAVLKHRTLEGFFGEVAAVLRERMPAIDDFGLARYDEGRHLFEVIQASGAGAPSNRGVKTRDTADTPGGYLLKVRRTVMINDMDAFESQAGVNFRTLFPRPFASAIGALLESGDRVLGYFYVTSPQKNQFGEEQRDTLDGLRGVLSLAFENALAYAELARLKERAELEGEYLRREVSDAWPADGMVGRSKQWREVLQQVAQVAPAESTVLIHGETGTGKEVIARAIHERSRRAAKPLIKINCGALPENLVESELFGHEKGAFTGALGRRIGRFELAHGGTIFLDEIGEMPPALQVKLLRVLQEREFERVGGEKPIKVDVRVIAATNKNLAEEVEKGRFRSDLFYRLNVFPVALPPLRERREDAVELAQYFLGRIGERMGRRPLRLSEGSLEALRAYDWPGNVRELEHLVERGIILSTGPEVDLAMMLQKPNAIVMPAGLPDMVIPVKALSEGKSVSLRDSFLEAERVAIEAALAECGGVVGGKQGAAARLGLKRQTLQSKMKKLGIKLSKPERAIAV